MNKFKEILIKLNNWKFVILIIVILGGSFYWFEIRPAKIYSKCGEWYVKQKMGSIENYDFMYKYCIRANGINK